MWPCLTEDSQVTQIFSHGAAKERLRFVLKFSDRGQVLTSNSRCLRGKVLQGEIMCVGGEQIYPLPAGDLGKGEGGCWGRGDGRSVTSPLWPFPGPFQ